MLGLVISIYTKYFVRNRYYETKLDSVCLLSLAWLLCTHTQSVYILTGDERHKHIHKSHMYTHNHLNCLWEYTYECQKIYWFSQTDNDKLTSEQLELWACMSVCLQAWIYSHIRNHNTYLQLTGVGALVGACHTQMDKTIISSSSRHKQILCTYINQTSPFIHLSCNPLFYCTLRKRVAKYHQYLFPCGTSSNMKREPSTLNQIFQCKPDSEVKINSPAWALL